MSKKVSDWDEAADDTFTYLQLGNRAFQPSKMLAFLDDLIVRGTASQAELIQLHGSDNFIATTLSNVTTAVHGGGAVPKDGGWYSANLDPLTYRVNEKFVSAWKKKRRLG